MPVIEQTSGNDWIMYRGDCVKVLSDMPADSVDYCLHSPPFSNLYIYSDDMADMGNSADHEEFFQHYGFAIRELWRITRPGRLCSVHCKDLPLYMNRDGASGLYDFPGDIVRHFTAAGWVFHSRVTIWKDPVIEMQRTKTHGLLWKNFTERGEVVRQGMADYVLTFRKWVDEMPDKQVRNSPQPGDYIGENPPRYYDGERDYSIQVWQRYASPVWFDIRQTNVLNYELARDSEDERHICPLQLDLIERCVQMWTNPGEVVLDPFMGIGSTGLGALKQHRRAVGVELKGSYYNVACRNLARAEDEANTPTLFDLLPAEQEAA